MLIHSASDVTAPEAYIGLVREKHIDGIILSGPHSDDQQLPRLKAENFPIVLLRQLPGSDLPFVDVDNVGAAKQALEHLIDIGTPADRDDYQCPAGVHRRPRPAGWLSSGVEGSWAGVRRGIDPLRRLPGRERR